ncbi:MAG: GGDEF domain-containing protein [Deltaproteobacteria bacterium]|nr:GGDEF domain-containing protein [Deltaproteobacteria bacterium]
MSQGGDSRSGSPYDADSLRTLRLDEGTALRDELFESLRDERRAALAVIAGTDVGARYRLQGSTRVGRDPAADITLLDAGVSWHHCLFEDRGGAWAVVDLGSTNGVLVNGRKVATAILAANDRIAVGRSLLRFEQRDAVEQAYDEQLERLINVDDLTGLLLRRRFDRELAAMVEVARSQSSMLGLLVMDLDGVKLINDSNGHEFGAAVIATAGRCIGEVIGELGIASRFGGDEYCAALPNHSAQDAMAVAEAVHQAINRARFEHNGIVLTPGISIGVACFPDDASTAATLFQRADQAMYRAKNGGRNRVSR